MILNCQILIVQPVNSIVHHMVYQLSITNLMPIQQIYDLKDVLLTFLILVV